MSLRQSACVEILDQIVRMLEADREPEQRLGRAASPGLRSMPVFDQAFHSAEAGGANENLRSLGSAMAASRPPFTSNESIPLNELICSRGDLMLRVRGEPGIMHPLDLRMSGEKVRDLACAFSQCARIRQGNVCNPAKDQPAIER